MGLRPRSGWLGGTNNPQDRLHLPPPLCESAAPPTPSPFRPAVRLVSFNFFSFCFFRCVVFCFFFCKPPQRLRTSDCEKGTKKLKNPERAAAQVPAATQSLRFGTHHWCQALETPPLPPPRKLYWVIYVFFCGDCHGDQVLLLQGALGAARELFAFLDVAPLSF